MDPWGNASLYGVWDGERVTFSHPKGATSEEVKDPIDTGSLDAHSRQFV